MNQREQELQNHRQQMAPLRVWQTQLQPRVPDLMNRREALEQQKQTQAQSAGQQWIQIDENTRMAYVMDLLVTKYGYPASRNKRPRTDPQVVAVFKRRRKSAQRALTSFNNSRRD
ncbi:MAG: hypothetical protein ACPL8I_05210 [Chloroflexaceae bacterium]